MKTRAARCIQGCQIEIFKSPRSRLKKSHSVDKKSRDSIMTSQIQNVILMASINNIFHVLQQNRLLTTKLNNTQQSYKIEQ